MKKLALLLALCLFLTACGPLKKKQDDDFSSDVEEFTTTTENITLGEVPMDGATTIGSATDGTTVDATTSGENTDTTTSHPTSTTIIPRPTAADTTNTTATTAVTTNKKTTTAQKPTTTTSKNTTTTTKKTTTTTKKTTTTTKPAPTADKPDGVHTAMELEVFRLLNEERQSQGLTPLTLSMEAHAAAEVRAQEASIEWSHTRPDGTSCFTVLQEFGISYWTAGENLAAGYQTGAALHNGWKNSPGHYANMMRGNFTSVAIAVYFAPNGYPYACELFLG